MGLFLGLGLLGAAFALDTVQSAPDKRCIARMRREFGEHDLESNELFRAIKSGNPFHGKQIQPDVERKALYKLYYEYGVNKNGIEDVARDVAVLAARDFGIKYSGWMCNAALSSRSEDVYGYSPLGFVGRRNPSDFEITDSVNASYYYKLKELLAVRFEQLSEEDYSKIEMEIKEERRIFNNIYSHTWLTKDGVFDRAKYEQTLKEEEERRKRQEMVRRSL